MCVVLVLDAVRFGLWTMMAERCFSVDDSIVLFSSNFSKSSSVIASYFVFFFQVISATAAAFVLFSSNSSNSSSVIASYFFFKKQFQQNSSENRKRIRQLRAPSLLDSGGFVSLLLLPAARQAGRACSALCVLFSYSLLCALVCGR